MQYGWQGALQVRAPTMEVPFLGSGPATVMVEYRGAHYNLPSPEETGLIQPNMQDPSFH